MAIPSVAMFRAAFPEFGATAADGAGDDLILVHIGWASEICDATIYGTRHTQACMFTAADSLARSPFARDMKLVAKDGSTFYSQRTKHLMRVGACGIRAL